MADIIDLALIGGDGVTFDEGFGTSKNVGIRFQIFCFFAHELNIFKEHPQTFILSSRGVKRKWKNL